MDLDTMGCVSECDLENQIEINDSVMHSIPLCRSLQYYLNPLSESPVELGTIDHPYKTFNSMLVELTKFHSHQGTNVTVNIMEESVVYWLQSEVIISNITNLSIKTYSQLRSDGNKANVVGIEDPDYRVAPGRPTRFNILSDDIIRYTEQISDNSALSEAEKKIVFSAGAIFLSHRSSVKFENLVLTTEYASIVSSTNFFDVITENVTDFVISN